MERRSSGVTLVELIVSTLIVSMVVAGVFSADYALRRINETGAQDIQTNIQTKTVAEAVRSTVKTLHGFPANRGVTIDLPNKTLCFRHDVQVAGSYTPAIYDPDDQHTCYTQIGTSVYRCEKNAALVCDNTDVYVGALVSDQFTNATILAQGPAISADGFFAMTFVGRKDPSAGAAVNAGNLTTGDATNPQVVVQIYENAAGF